MSFNTISIQSRVSIIFYINLLKITHQWSSSFGNCLKLPESSWGKKDW